MFLCRRLFVVLLPVLAALFASSRVAATPTPEAVLQEMSSIDTLFLSGFTAEGTIVYAPMYIRDDLPPLRKKWQLTTIEGSFAYQEEAVEILTWDFFRQFAEIPRPKYASMALLKPLEAYSSVVYCGPDISGKFDITAPPNSDTLEIWLKNRDDLATGADLMQDNPGLASFGVFRDIILWSLGRGYASNIQEISEILSKGDLLHLSAKGRMRDGAPEHWEMEIDETAMYMVRRARRFAGDDLVMEFRNSGTRLFGRCIVPETMTFVDLRGGYALHIPVEVTSAGFEVDQTFLESAEKDIASNDTENLQVIDNRAPIRPVNPADAKPVDPGTLIASRFSNEVIPDAVLNDVQLLKEPAGSSEESTHSAAAAVADHGQGRGAQESGVRTPWSPYRGALLLGVALLVGFAGWELLGKRSRKR